MAKPHLPSKPGGYPSYFSHDSTHFVEETGGEILFPNAKRVERAAAVRKLLLPGSGCLEFLKGMAGMDFLSKHVELKSPFGSASHFAKLGSCKAGSPTSNPLLLKAQSR